VAYTKEAANDGTFLFGDVSPGRYILSAEREGFVAGRYGAKAPTDPGTPISLDVGQNLINLEVMLLPEGIIAGQITDAAATPVRGAQVIAFQLGYEYGHRQLKPTQTVSSDEDGRFRLGNLTPGRYFLRASDHPYDAAEGGGGINAPESNSPTYYPESIDDAAAVGIDISAGAELSGIDVRLKKGHMLSIRGNVRALDAAANSMKTPENVMLVLLKREETLSSAPRMAPLLYSARSPNATFEFHHLTAGNYILKTVAPGGINGSHLSQLVGRTEITLTDKDADGVVLRVREAAEVSGRLRLENGDVATLFDSQKDVLLPGTQPHPTPTKRPLITLVDAETRNIVGTLGSEVSEDYAFKITAVGAGTYYVNVLSLPAGAFIEAIHFGNIDVTHTVLDLTSVTTQPLDIVLSSKGGDVAGVVKNEDDQGIGGVQVTIWPKSPDAGQLNSGIRSVNTDTEGGFQITGLAPGEYYVASWDNYQPGITEVLGFLSFCVGDATPVTILDRGHVQVALKVVARDRMAAAAAALP
jgi:hypothetical protein